jgi:polar amino acid transport system substrate-binding protein
MDSRPSRFPSFLALTALFALASTAPLPAVGAAPAPLPGAGSTPGAVSPPATPADTVGVFTREQSSAGKDLYEVECSFCHGPREFAGGIFQRRWLTPPVSGIFAHILNTMPQDAPGSLAPAQVASIVAYILELNGQPAGPTPLPVEMEKLARIRVPTGSGSESERR